MDEAIRPINVQTTKQRIKSYSSNPGSLILAVLVGLAALITFLTLVFIIGYILVMGIPNLKPSLFQLEYNSDNVSMLPSIINTVGMTLLSLVIAGPLGILAAVYLVEYAKKGNKLVSVVRVTAETLTGIPSIVYGLFGCNCTEVGLFYAGRRLYTGYYGPSCYHEDHRGSSYGGAGYVS